MCDPNLNLRPDLFIDLSTFTPCKITLIQHITRERAGRLFTSQGYPPLVTFLIMSQKLWFEGDVIRKTLVGILEEEMVNNLQMKPTVWKVMTRTRTRSTMTINNHLGVQHTHLLPLLLKATWT